MPQRRPTPQLGITPSGSGSASGIALSLAATWIALSFVPTVTGRALSKFYFFPSTLTGSLAASDVVCDLCSDSAASPNASIESRATLASAIAGGSWNSVTGFTAAMTQGTQYWGVFKNVNATPASNNPTIKFISGAPRGPSSFTTIAQGWAKKQSADSGATWAGSSQVEAGGWMVEYDDGSVEGWPVNDIAAGVVGIGVYAGRKCGAKFTTNANSGMSIRGVNVYMSKTASPTGTARVEIYQGTTLVATSLDLPIATINSSNIFPFLFASAVELAASTSYRVVLAESTQADASANRYNVFEYAVMNTAAAKSLGPMQGTWQRTYYDGSTWTDTDTAWPVVALLLDTDGPFVAAAASSSSTFVING